MPEGKKWRPPSDEEKRKRLSRVILDLNQPGSAEQGERREKILEQAKERKGLQRLLKEKPFFHEEDETAEQSIHIESDWQDIQDSDEYKKMLENPTGFFESAALIDRGELTTKKLPTGKTIGELFDKPYDVSRVRVVKFGDKQIVVKRVDEKKVAYSLEEFDLAKKIQGLGIPTAAPVGTIEDKGNTYLLFEYLEETVSALEVIIDSSEYPNSIDMIYSNEDYPFKDPSAHEEVRQLRIVSAVHSLLMDLHMYLQHRFLEKKEIDTIVDRKKVDSPREMCERLNAAGVSVKTFRKWLESYNLEMYNDALDELEDGEGETGTALTVENANAVVESTLRRFSKEDIASSISKMNADYFRDVHGVPNRRLPYKSMENKDLHGAEALERDCILLLARLGRLQTKLRGGIEKHNKQHTRTTYSPFFESIKYRAEVLSQLGVDYESLRNWLTALFEKGENRDIRSRSEDGVLTADYLLANTISNVLCDAEDDALTLEDFSERVATVFSVVRDFKQEKIAKLEVYVDEEIHDIDQRNLGVEFGNPLDKFKQDVANKTEAAGIVLKDVTNKNILVKTDDEGNLLPDEQGKAQFYIIDFETKLR